MKRNHYRRGALHKLLQGTSKEERWRILIAVAKEIARLKKLKEMEDADQQRRQEEDR